jgi:SAM-dependent methyltransferase
VIRSDTRRRRGVEVKSRYSLADLDVLTEGELTRFACGAGADPRSDETLAWELLYRLEPELYDRLAAAERIHPEVLAWLPRDVGRIAEVGAGTGRLTLELIDRAREVAAIEPAAPLRELLERKLSRLPNGNRVRVMSGFFDALPIADDFADLVVACSAMTPADGHGGDAGLAEMERVCRPGGLVAIVWPNEIPWLEARGYRYLSFGGHGMAVEFASAEEAAELTEIFYPRGAEEVRRRSLRRVPYELVAVNPPCDLAYKAIPR